MLSAETLVELQAALDTIERHSKESPPVAADRRPTIALLLEVCRMAHILIADTREQQARFDSLFKLHKQLVADTNHHIRGRR